MPSFLALLSCKRRGELTDNLLQAHVAHLQSLTASGNLVLCGPFANNDGAMQVLRADSPEHARQLLEADPFIEESYYQDFELIELIEANQHNNWLLTDPQTTGNLAE